MKIATCLLCLWCVTKPCPGQTIPGAPGQKPGAESQAMEVQAASYRASIKSTRVQEQADMIDVVFSQESVFVSEPSDRLLFQHESNVTRFIGTYGKFGLDRISTIHMSNPRLATHGGVGLSPLSAEGNWQENKHHYALTRPWGMIGDLDQKNAKAYLFRPSPYLRRNSSASANDERDAEAYALSPFEHYALIMLRKGEKLVRWENERTMHAVGAVRAEVQCLRCHEDCKPGDLLGAFTYSFTKSNAKTPDAREMQMLKLVREGKTMMQIAAEAKKWKAPATRVPGMQPDEEVSITLLRHAVVTTEMLTQLDQARKSALEADLGPVKKPKTSAGAE